MDSNRDTREDAALNALFAAADSQRPAPSSDFLARLHADAETAKPSATPEPKGSGSRAWTFPLRGFFTASGLTAATALGVWIGVVLPETLVPYTTATEDSSVGLYTFLPGADLTAALSE